MNIPRPRRRGRGGVVAFLTLAFVAFVMWPFGMFVTVVLLLPPAAIVFPILEAGRIAESMAFRFVALYGVVTFAGLFVVVSLGFPSFVPVIMLFPFFAALLAIVREGLPR